MVTSLRQAIINRQVQWDAFHRWEAAREGAALPLEERIAWYVSAARLSQASSVEACFEEIRARVNLIRQRRERLAQLNRSLDV